MLRTGQVSWGTRLTGVVLALGVVAAHIADQGGVTAFNDTADWLGWAYRLIEVGGVATAAVLLLAGDYLVMWAAAVLLGAAPALGFLASRTVGVPGDSGDKGNWAWDVGALSLVIEVSLVALALGVFAEQRVRPRATHSVAAEPTRVG